MSDSRVPINFPRPVQKTHSLPTPLKPPLKPQPTETKPRSRNNYVFPSNFINALLKRGLSIRPKIDNPGGTVSETADEPVPRRSFDGRIHRFSFMGERRSRPAQTVSQHHTPKPFETTLHRVQESAGLLSTSTGVRFKPPKILVDLAEKEKMVTHSRLLADERIALSSLLGWDGKNTEGRGMSGTLGFVRYQSLSVLYSRHIPPLPLEGSSSASTVSSSTPSSILQTTTTTAELSLCGKPYWATYCYYSSGDRRLGDMINDLAKDINLPCERPGCLFTRGQHEIRIMHGGTRIVIRTSKSEVEDSADDAIQMWQSCAICDARTARTNMHDGALYVLPFHLSFTLF